MGYDPETKDGVAYQEGYEAGLSDGKYDDRYDYSDGRSEGRLEGLEEAKQAIKNFTALPMSDTLKDMLCKAIDEQK